MAELADAYGSGPYESNFMQVQVLLPAPKRKRLHEVRSFFFFGGKVAGLNLKKAKAVKKTIDNRF